MLSQAWISWLTILLVFDKCALLQVVGTRCKYVAIEQGRKILEDYHIAIQTDIRLVSAHFDRQVEFCPFDTHLANGGKRKEIHPFCVSKGV